MTSPLVKGDGFRNGKKANARHGRLRPTQASVGLSTIRHIKLRPNDRNMPTQHIATLLGVTCCVRLATVLRCVATCWVLLAQI